MLFGTESLLPYFHREFCFKKLQGYVQFEGTKELFAVCGNNVSIVAFNFG